MAKEAIELVKKAEAEAENIIIKAEADANELIKEAKEKCRKDISAAKENIVDDHKVCMNKEAEKNSADLESYKSEVTGQCKERYNEIMKNKDEIINLIIEAVKKG